MLTKQQLRIVSIYCNGMHIAPAFIPVTLTPKLLDRIVVEKAAWKNASDQGILMSCGASTRHKFKTVFISKNEVTMKLASSIEYRDNEMVFGNDFHVGPFAYAEGQKMIVYLNEIVVTHSRVGLIKLFLPAIINYVAHIAYAHLGSLCFSVFNNA